jgi:hypothetical protein
MSCNLAAAPFSSSRSARPTPRAVKEPRIPFATDGAAIKRVTRPSAEAAPAIEVSLEVIRKAPTNVRIPATGAAPTVGHLGEMAGAGLTYIGCTLLDMHREMGMNRKAASQRRPTASGASRDRSITARLPASHRYPRRRVATEGCVRNLTTRPVFRRLSGPLAAKTARPRPNRVCNRGLSRRVCFPFVPWHANPLLHQFPIPA